MTPRKAPFITIEGVDGAGKTSHIPAIIQRLKAFGFDVVHTREPGGKGADGTELELAERLRHEILHTPMTLQTQVLLAFASRAENLDKTVRPSLAAGRAVVSDRFTDSTYAFQGAGHGYPKVGIEELERQVHDDLKPDLTLLFDLPIAIARERLDLTGKIPDRFESQEADFHERVRAGYHERVAAAPGRFAVIDSSKPLEEVKTDVAQAIDAFVARWDNRPAKRPRP